VAMSLLVISPCESSLCCSCPSRCAAKRNCAFECHSVSSFHDICNTPNLYLSRIPRHSSRKLSTKFKSSKKSHGIPECNSWVRTRQRVQNSEGPSHSRFRPRGRGCDRFCCKTKGLPTSLLSLALFLCTMTESYTYVARKRLSSLSPFPSGWTLEFLPFHVLEVLLVNIL
jgi:hypothetical protein